MGSDPFEGFRTEETPDDDAFARLAEMVSNLDEAEKEVLGAETVLKIAQERERQIREHDLPEYMTSLGLETFRTTDGLTVEVKTKIRASIGERKGEAFVWLITHGHGALIKRTVEVAFNGGQEKLAEDLCLQLSQQDNAGVRQNMKVEPATLTAWVGSQLENGNPIPMDLFGVFEQRYASIKRERRMSEQVHCNLPEGSKSLCGIPVESLLGCTSRSAPQK